MNTKLLPFGPGRPFSPSGPFWPLPPGFPASPEGPVSPEKKQFLVTCAVKKNVFTVNTNASIDSNIMVHIFVRWVDA